MKTGAIYTAWLAMLCLVLLNGCGSSTSSNNPGTGRATFTVLWPKSGRLIPTAANSIVVQILYGGTVLASQTLPRPAGGGPTTVTFSSLGAGTLTATATAYPNMDGSGVAQAQASAPLTILANQNTNFSLTMNSTINTVDLTPANPRVSVGYTVQLTATARDAAGNVVLIAPQTLQWRSSNPAAGAVDSTGKVTGLIAATGANAPQITVTESESGKSGTTTVTVAGPVYSNDFESGTVDAAWSTVPLGASYAPLAVSATPFGNRHFLGQLGQQKAILTLQNLPPHTQVTVTFDLFIILTWDGNGGQPNGTYPQWGPDIWQLQVANGPTLLNTTFSNWHDNLFSQLTYQAYPDSFPTGSHPAQTGATEANTLGYAFTSLDIPVSVPSLDSVYHLSYRFAHTAGSLELDFNGMENEAINNENWGLDNVQVFAN